MAKKAVKKKWVDIQTTKVLGNAKIGQAYVDDPNKIIGRTIKVNLMNLLNDPKKRRYSVSLEVENVKDGIGHAKPIIYSIAPSALKTLVRKNRDRVDHYITLTLSDDSKAIIKPLITTRGNTSKQVSTALRAKCSEMILARAKKLNFEQLFTQALQMKLQRELKKELSSIYPLASFEIKVLKVAKK